MTKSMTPHMLAGLAPGLGRVMPTLLGPDGVGPWSPLAPPSRSSALYATDPDGDRLTYTVVTAPSLGTVTVAPYGTFTYTPDAALAAAGGTGGFTVLVPDNDPGSAAGPTCHAESSDAGTHCSRPGCRAHARGHRRHVVAPPAGNISSEAPTTPSTPTVERGTGAATSSLGMADGNPLTFTVIDEPSTRTATLDHTTTGTYSSTLTEAARRVAAGTTGADTVTFSVLLSDGEGGQTPVERTMAVHAELGGSRGKPGSAGVQPIAPAPTAPSQRRCAQVGATGSPIT